VLVCKMGKRMKSKDFLAGYDQLWRKGPEVKYSNPEISFRHAYSVSHSTYLSLH
jgi:hypothetical protein